ncbi:MAG TPA: hypothetical protein VGK53_18465 [Propionicimonas sp.]|jgi:hypothetical protein
MSGNEQSIRQEARRRVNEALLVKQREREAREKQISTHAVTLLTALAARAVAVTEAEHAAAAAIHKMLEGGLTTAEIVDWCGGELDGREVARLQRLFVPAAGE